MYYTNDGIRHASKEEALNYLEQYITELPPFEDEYVQALHGHKWGKYEIQSIPKVDDSLYLELIRNHFSPAGEHVGLNHIIYHDANKPESVDVVAEFLDKKIATLDMINSEIRSSIVLWSKDGKHLEIADSEREIPLQLGWSISYDEHDGEPKNEMHIHYVLDYMIEGVVDVTDADPLSALLIAIENHMVLEVNGMMEDDKVNGYNVFTILDTANRENMSVSLKIGQAN